MPSLPANLMRAACGCFGLLLLLCGGCQENFQASPPFPAVAGDTVQLDVDSWYYVDQLPGTAGDVPLYPFTYQIFEDYFDGFLLHTPERIYILEQQSDFSQRKVLLDLRAEPGDTIFKYSNFQYRLLINRIEEAGDPVFYVLRRSKIGVKRLRERALWVMSPTRGILAVANYDIHYADGEVTLDMMGDPDYFSDPDLIDKIKFYDNDVAYMVDRDRHIIYLFDKFKGVLKSKDFNADEDLYEYRFDQANTRNLIDFRISLENGTVQLIAGDSCYFFSQTLELLRSSSCR